jgi:hypothetical protein
MMLIGNIVKSRYSLTLYRKFHLTGNDGAQ